MSQAGLAKACGWASQSRVGNYERDTREPTLEDIALMAKVIGVRQDLLLTDSGTEGAASQGAHQAERAVALMDFATPRTRTVLERINQAARMGRLSEADIDLLDQIAARFESSAGHAAGSEGSHGRLREKLQNHDPHPKQ